MDIIRIFILYYLPQKVAFRIHHAIFLKTSGKI